MLFGDAPLCLGPVIFFIPRFKFFVYHKKDSTLIFHFSLLVNRMVVLFLGRIVTIRDELWAL